MNILEAATSSFEQKWLVVEAIAKICSDAQVSTPCFFAFFIVNTKEHIKCYARSDFRVFRFGAVVEMFGFRTFGWATSISSNDHISDVLASLDRFIYKTVKLCENNTGMDRFQDCCKA